MLILSQDSNRLINFNNVNQVFIVGKEIFVDTEKNTALLGEYKNAERAKEVMQEIIKTYKESGNVKIDNVQKETKLVYEMPEK